MGAFSVEQIVQNSRTLGAKSGSALGSWVIGQWYAVGDIVNYQGNLYTSIQAGIGQTPTSAPAYWSLTGAGMPMDAITDPALNAAVTTAKVDAYSGTIITLTAAGNDQTLGAPTDTTPGKRFYVVNNDTSTDNIDIIGNTTITVEPGHSQAFMYDGSAWIHISSVDADEITYNPAASYLSDTNVQSAFDTVFTSDGILFTKGSQNYLFTDRSTNLVLQGQTTAQPSYLEYYSKDGDGTDQVGFVIRGVGTPADISAHESLLTRWNGSDAYEIYTSKVGAGTLRPLVLYTEGNANQLYLATDGSATFGGNVLITPTKKLDFGNMSAIYESSSYVLDIDNGGGPVMRFDGNANYFYFGDVAGNNFYGNYLKIANSTANFVFYSGASELLKLTTSNATFGGNVSIPAAKKLYLDGGGDTYLHEQSADDVELIVNGLEYLKLEAGATSFIGSDSV